MKIKTIFFLKFQDAGMLKGVLDTFYLWPKRKAFQCITVESCAFGSQVNFLTSVVALRLNGPAGPGGFLFFLNIFIDYAITVVPFPTPNSTPS